MVIVLKPSITQTEKTQLKTFLTRRNFKINEVRGEEETVLAAVGKLSLDVREVQMLPGVSRVIPISKPYKLASREFKREDTVVTLAAYGQTLKIGGSRICVIAGPSAIESKEQLFTVAQSLALSGAGILCGGSFRSALSPYEFQGLGKKALQWLKQAGKQFGMPVCTEVFSAEQVTVAQPYVDVLLVGPKNMANGELLKKVSASGKPVILCRSSSATIKEFLLSAECLLSYGAEQVILCESGIRTFEGTTRSTLDLSAVPLLKELTHLPVIVDPCAAVGNRDKIPSLAIASVACGSDGIALDVHNAPEEALCDGAQSLYLSQFDKVMHDIQAMCPVAGKVLSRVHEVSGVSAAKKTNAKAKQISCAYSGTRGAYAEQAVGRYFDGLDVKSVAVDSFAQIFQQVTDGTVQYGMVPIENSLAGSVYQNYDNFLRFEDVRIVGAVTLNIRHALLGVKGASIEDIKQVYSHPQGFAQCKKFLDSHSGWTHIDAVSTATAADLVHKSKSKENAAIASEVNASLYKLSVLAQDIADDPGNFTRFVVIAAPRKKAASKNLQKPNMASFLFKCKNEPGALCRALGVLEKYRLNLTRLESRPIPGEPWRYWFYADADMQALEAPDHGAYIDTVLESLSQTVEQVRLLGLYSEIRF